MVKMNRKDWNDQTVRAVLKGMLTAFGIINDASTVDLGQAMMEGTGGTGRGRRSGYEDLGYELALTMRQFATIPVTVDGRVLISSNFYDEIMGREPTLFELGGRALDQGIETLIPGDQVAGEESGVAQLIDALVRLAPGGEPAY